MKFSILFPGLLCSILLLNSVSLAFETDQFNLPKVPLADIGEEVSEHLIENLRLAVDSVNANIAKSEACLAAKTKGCESPEKEREKLEHLHTDEAIADAFSKLIAGGNFMTTKFGKWLNSHEFRSQPARYTADYRESIYVLNPFDFATISPTVRLYGHEFGVDKLEHLFQQGHQYYDIVGDAIKKGSTPDEAVQKAIKWGQKTERTYYGLWTSGVYSNADLFANYVGLKFYQNMTKPLEIAETKRPPLVELSNGNWKIVDKTLKEIILKPFITDHMNEALNPSSYRPTLVGSVRRSVKKYACSEWRNVPGLSPWELETKAASLETWNGEQYGSTKRDRTVKLADICFEKVAKPTDSD
ncbi:MAG: hypothetical protein ABL999_10840 [Pyrinomonadaceae bacterium]